MISCGGDIYHEFGVLKGLHIINQFQKKNRAPIVSGIHLSADLPLVNLDTNNILQPCKMLIQRVN